MAEGQWPLDSDGNKLCSGCDVEIHGVPEERKKSMLNGQIGRCAWYDEHVNRVFVKVKIETLAFAPSQLRLTKGAEENMSVAQIAESRKEFPRGHGGAVLYPGTIVKLRGLRGKRIKLNGKEGACEYWDSENQLMDVRMRDSKQIETVGNLNLTKVRMEEDDALGKEGLKILKIFQNFDVDGDGTLDLMEFDAMLKALGMDKLGGYFLKVIDKDGDQRIRYEEFLEWALSPVAHGSARKNLELYWPEKRSSTLVRPDPSLEKAEDADDEHGDDLSIDDVIKICNGHLPRGWPKHGLTVINNMHTRFPDYPVEGIVSMMVFHDFIGGKVLAAIRDTGADECDAHGPGTTVVPGIFPATYEVQVDDGIPVFDESDKAWSWNNMRKRTVTPVGFFRHRQKFVVFEVRKGSQYGLCFGRVEWGRSSGIYWTDLGLEVSGEGAVEGHDAIRQSVRATVRQPKARTTMRVSASQRAAGMTGFGPQCSDARCVG